MNNTMSFLTGCLTEVALRLCVHHHLQVFFKLKGQKPWSKKPDAIKGVRECLFLPSSTLSMFSIIIMSKTGPSWCIMVMISVNWEPLKHLNYHILLEAFAFFFFYANASEFGVNCFLNLLYPDFIQHEAVLFFHTWYFPGDQLLRDKEILQKSKKFDKGLLSYFLGFSPRSSHLEIQTSCYPVILKK